VEGTLGKKAPLIRDYFPQDSAISSGIYFATSCTSTPTAPSSINSARPTAWPGGWTDALMRVPTPHAVNFKERHETQFFRAMPPFSSYAKRNSNPSLHDEDGRAEALLEMNRVSASGLRCPFSLAGPTGPALARPVVRPYKTGTVATILPCSSPTRIPDSFLKVLQRVRPSRPPGHSCNHPVALESVSPTRDFPQRRIETPGVLHSPYIQRLYAKFYWNVKPSKFLTLSRSA
jgi:hypothetical protein